MILAHFLSNLLLRHLPRHILTNWNSHTFTHLVVRDLVVPIILHNFSIAFEFELLEGDDVLVAAHVLQVPTV